MQNNNAGGDAGVQLTDQKTIRRIRKRQAEGESADDIVSRLLDNTIEEVCLETIVNEIRSHYDHVAGIAVELSDVEEPTMAQISVATADAFPYEDPAEVFQSGRYRLAVEEDGCRLCSLPFTVVAAPDGMKFETVATTPVYEHDELSPADGIKRFKEKLGLSRDELREDIRGRLPEAN